MKKGIQNKVVFIGKSMLWAVLLYMTMMLVIYRDEVSNTITGRNAVAVITDHPATDSPVIASRKQGVIKSIAAIVRTLSGFASVAVGS